MTQQVTNRLDLISIVPLALFLWNLIRLRNVSGKRLLQMLGAALGTGMAFGYIVAVSTAGATLIFRLRGPEK